jgi:hypothetical protein
MINLLSRFLNLFNSMIPHHMATVKLNLNAFKYASAKRPEKRKEEGQVRRPAHFDLKVRSPLEAGCPGVYASR